MNNFFNFTFRLYSLKKHLTNKATHKIVTKSIFQNANNVNTPKAFQKIAPNLSGGEKIDIKISFAPSTQEIKVKINIETITIKNAYFISDHLRSWTV